MSTLGPLGVPAISAAARNLRTIGDVNQTHQNQAVEGQANLRSVQAIREIGEEGTSVGDREADGRQAWHAPSHPHPETTPAAAEADFQSTPAKSPTNARGQRLDVNL